MPGSERFFFTAGKWQAKQGFDAKWFDSPGFLIHPFDPSKGDTFLLKDNIGILGFSEDDLQRLSKMDLTSISVPDFPKQFNWMNNQERMSSFKEVVEKARREIRENKYEKIVSSRVEITDLETGPWEIFLKLSQKHPNAFVSYVSIESLGQWIGASPELLCRLEAGRKLKTVALAGTSRSGEFGKKENQEQDLVGKYIEEKFISLGITEFEKSEKDTISSGEVKHLSSNYLATIPQSTDLSELVRALHPTPAVAGIPKEKSVAFISKNENHPRSFYSGFLGPFASEEVFSFYVNLRCMQVFKEKAVLYSGAGITEDSEPNLELEETNLKIQSLKDALG